MKIPVIASKKVEQCIFRNNVYERVNSYTHESEGGRDGSRQKRTRFRHAVTYLLACSGYHKESG